MKPDISLWFALFVAGCAATTSPPNSSSSNWLRCENLEDCAAATAAVACKRGLCVDARDRQLLDPQTRSSQSADAGQDAANAGPAERDAAADAAAMMTTPPAVDTSVNERDAAPTGAPMMTPPATDQTPPNGTPVAMSPPAGAAWIALDGGADHTCAIKPDHSLWCWGQNFYGQLGVAPAEVTTCTRGTGNSIPCATTPNRVPGDDWASVSAGHQHTCAIKLDGSLWCWGANSSGALGLGAAGDPVTSPTRVGTATDWTAVAAGEEHTCGLTSEGALFCWGYNSEGELGIEAAGQDCGSGGRCVPSPLRTGAESDWRFVTAAGQITLAIRGDGALYGWGSSFEAQLACAQAECRNTRVAIGDTADWVSASTWASHSCAIKRDGSLWCWQGIDGTGGTGRVPQRIELPEPVTQVASGEEHTCAVTTSGALYCAGSDEVGQLAIDPTTLSKCDGQSPCQRQMTLVDPGQAYFGVVAGYLHNCAMRMSDARISCWGVNSAGQLGNPAATTCDYTGVEEQCSVRPIAIAE